jgi:hypothetical protein
MATQVEIVDMFGNQIPGAVGVTTSTGLNIHSGTMISIDPNATGWAGVSSLLDHTAAFGRRIKVTTPFGVSTSNATQGGAFTVSGRPEFGATAQDTFAGGGYDGGTNTYTQGAGDLVINGTNFRGVNRVTFIGGGTTNVDIDPNNPPAGYAVSADGTQLTVQSGVIPAHWIGGASRTITLRSAASQSGTTQNITTN